METNVKPWTADIEYQKRLKNTKKKKNENQSKVATFGTVVVDGRRVISKGRSTEENKLDILPAESELFSTNYFYLWPRDGCSATRRLSRLPGAYGRQSPRRDGDENIERKELEEKDGSVARGQGKKKRESSKKRGTEREKGEVNAINISALWMSAIIRAPRRAGAFSLSLSLSQAAHIIYLHTPRRVLLCLCCFPPFSFVSLFCIISKGETMTAGLSLVTAHCIFARIFVIIDWLNFQLV